MKKSFRLILILLVVLAMCVGTYAALIYRTTDDTSEDDSQNSQNVSLCNLVDALYISISRPDIKMEFINDGDTWTYYQDQDFPLDETYLAAVKNAILNLTASRTIEIAESLEAYGLDSDFAYVTAIDSENHVFGLQIGNPIDYSYSTFYARIPDEDVIYVISNELPDAISFDLSDMLEMESFGSFDPEDISEISVQQGEQLIVYKQETVTESVPTGEIDEDTGSEIYEDKTVSTWYDTTSETPVLLTDTAASNAEALAEAASSFQFTALKNYNASETYLTSCGLDDAALTITVTWKLPTGTETSQTLLVGRLDGEGNYWAKLPSSQAAYTISCSLIDPFFDIIAQ